MNRCVTVQPAGKAADESMLDYTSACATRSEGAAQTQAELLLPSSWSEWNYTLLSYLLVLSNVM